jgi:hypothetical protein
MNNTANAHAMDGFDVWFFGGTPGPNEPDHGCALSEPHVPSIDEDDARIPSFAHRCDCGSKHVPAIAGARRAAAIPALGTPALALHV